MTNRFPMLLRLALLSFLLSPPPATLAQSTNTNASATLPSRTMLTMGGLATTPARKASPRLDVTTLPVPPMQGQPWTAPADPLPESFVSATRLLFDAGLADPRGCEYRDIEIGTGSPWSGDGGVVPTRGWMLPGEGSRKFAVCWNGLVYPVVTVGAVADWKADTRAAIALGKGSFRSAGHEGYTTFASALLPLKGCLLLRLGEPQLAADFWAAVQRAGGMPKTPQHPPPNPAILPQIPGFNRSADDPYLTWAADWAWSMFERAVCAHMRGDDRLALADARALTRIRALVERSAAERGFERQRTFNSPWDGKHQNYLNFLEQLPLLLADQERREAKPNAKTILETGLDSFTNRTERIAALIENLDEVVTRQWSQPGGLGNWERNPIVAALIAEREDAIEPLLKFLDAGGGKRLTRSVSFGRDFHRGRNLRPVSQPAALAVMHILGVSEAALGFGGGSWHWEALPEGFSRAVREYRKQFGQLSEVERWYVVLKDAAADQTKWQDAINNIVAAEKAPVGQTNKTPVRLRGEPLRQKSHPSVTELLLQRATDWKPRHPGSTFDIGERMNFLLQIAGWDAQATLPLLQQFMREHLAQFEKHFPLQAPNGNYHSYMSSQFPAGAAAIIHVTEGRFNAGDVVALDEYAAWIRQLRADHYAAWVQGHYHLAQVNLLGPMWRHPEHAAIREAAREIFSRPDSPWRGLEWLPQRGGFNRSMSWEALAIPQTHSLIRDALTNLTLFAEGTVEANGKAPIKFASGATTTLGPLDARELPPGTKIVVHLCEVVAERLSGIHGFPEMDQFWPAPRRSQALAKIRETWNRYEPKLQTRPQPPQWSAAFDPPLIHLAFPELRQPATRKDVERADAIFHLDDPGESRRVALPQFPMPAVWPLGSRRRVTVWQAEEIVRDGKAERFFGLVAPHEIIRVPAREIEFPTEHDFGWTSMSNGVSCMITGPGVSFHNIPTAFTNAGGAIPVKFLFRNRSGLDRDVPVDWLRSAPARQLAPFVELRLAFAPVPDTAPKLRGGPFSSGAPMPAADSWRPLKPKPIAAETLPATFRCLGITEQMESGQLNLQDWFDTPEAGCYRLQIEFKPTGDGRLEKLIHTVFFQLAAAPTTQQ